MTEMVLVPRKALEVISQKDASIATAVEVRHWAYTLLASPSSPSAPVGEGWQPIETAPKDGSDILILANGMAIEARYEPGLWGPDIPGEVREYDGPVWVAFDDLTQFEIEEGLLDGGKDHHGAVTHWMPLPHPPALLSPGNAG